MKKLLTKATLRYFIIFKDNLNMTAIDTSSYIQYIQFIFHIRVNLGENAFLTANNANVKIEYIIFL